MTLLTRSRLARVQLDLGEHDKALATVADANSGSFKALFAEIRGDVLLAQGKDSEARAAYQLAADNLIPEQAGRRPLLEMKINDLQSTPVAGSATAPAAEELRKLSDKRASKRDQTTHSYCSPRASSARVMACSQSLCM